MSYSNLIAAWNAPTTPPAGVTGASLAGLATAAKIAAVNGWTVAGPAKDVSASSVLGYLALQGKLSMLQIYAAGAPTTGRSAAQVAACELVALFTLPSFTGFQMSNPAVYAACGGFLSALTLDAVSGIVAADVTNILALAATTAPWWESAGLSSPISAADLDAAGGLT